MANRMQRAAVGLALSLTAATPSLAQQTYVIPSACSPYPPPDPRDWWSAERPPPPDG